MEGIGIDRAIISSQKFIDDSDLFLARMKTLFDLNYNPLERKDLKIELSGNIDIFSRTNFINYIQIKKMGYRGYQIIIEFNYARFFSKDNFNLVTEQDKKDKVDLHLKKIIAYLSYPMKDIQCNFIDAPTWLYIKINKMESFDFALDYCSLEIAEQLLVNGFYKYTNSLLFFYKSLSNYYSEVKEKCIHENYKIAADKFYKTGFTFKPAKGLKIKIYNKTEEHNKKNCFDKKSGGSLRTEVVLTKMIIKRIFGSTNINLSLEKLQHNLNLEFKDAIVKAIKAQFEKDEKNLLEKLSMIKITPKNLELFVTTYNELIVDADWFNNILYRELVNKKSRSSVFEYTKCTKKQLKKLNELNSPIRDNLNNLKRLEQLVKNLFCINLKIKNKNGEKLQFFIN